MRRGLSRREFLSASGRASAAGIICGSLIPTIVVGPASARPLFDARARRTLRAAVARIIPSDGPGDWSAADLGADDYIERLLSGRNVIYAGGPYREDFDRFQKLTRAKEMGWANEIARLRKVYRRGLEELDRRAGGDFAHAPEAVQDALLESLDYEGSEFFDALYAHTMEGVYSHPVYGGNKNYRAWKDLAYEGDVHGVRFPTMGSKGAWNIYGGYAPEEIAQPGTGP